MRPLKAFFITFLSSVCVVFLSFGALYWLLSPSQLPAGNKQKNVPVITAESGDCKTTLAAADINDSRFFLLIKLNAVDKKVSVAAIDAALPLARPGRSLNQSFDYAGMMQCVEDLSEEFGIKIDYHILFNADSLADTVSSFGDVPNKLTTEFATWTMQQFSKDTPVTAAQLVDAVTENISYFGSKDSLGFFVNLAEYLIKNNMVNIHSYALENIKNNFSALTTNIGTTEAARLARIFTLLNRTTPAFETAVISSPETAAEDISRLFEQ